MKIIIIGIILTLTSCSNFPSYWPESSIIEKNELTIIREEIHAFNIQIQEKYPKNAPILVSTFVDLSDLKKSSHLGLWLSETISIEMTKQGYTIIEPRLKREISASNTNGPMLLSNNAKETSEYVKISAVLVGNYLEKPSHIDIFIKLINLTDNKTIGTSVISLKKTSNINSLIK